VALFLPTCQTLALQVKNPPRYGTEYALFDPGRQVPNHPKCVRFFKGASKIGERAVTNGQSSTAH
jgi:hypothetical protein